MPFCAFPRPRLLLRGLAACLSFFLLLQPVLAADDPLAGRWQAFLEARRADRPAEARTVLDDLVAQGYPVALSRLGHVLRHGEAWYGASADPARAFGLFERAWAAGASSGAYGMAYMFYKGEGRPRDDAQALAWFRKAGALGNEGALAMLGLFAQEGYGMAKDCAEAERLYTEAVAKGNEVSKYNLGLLYDKGCQGIAAQPDKALHWMRESAKGGDEDAKAYVAKREQAPPAFKVRPLGPSPEQLQLFNGALRAAAQMGFKADEIDNDTCTAQLRHSYQGRAVGLRLEVPVAGRVRGNVMVADDAIRTGFIRLYRQELAKQVGTAIDLDGNISGR